MIAKYLNRPDLGLLFFRLFVGSSMAFAHGMGKMPPSDQFTAGVETLGFPIPNAFAWAAALSEFAGGLLIALGLLTRPASYFLGTTMLVAALVQHSDDPFRIKELALFYFFSCLLLIFTGPGKYSLDSKFKR